MENELREIKQKILEKKELRGLSEDFLDNFLDLYYQKHKKTFEILEKKNYNEKSKEFDEIKKAVRKKLREVHGVFSKDILGEEKQKKILNSLMSAKKEKNLNKEEEILKNILKSHRSTLERKDSYLDVYSSLLKNVKFQKIIDLGCGYNPFSYKILEKATLKKPEYLSVDINEKDAKFIQKYFEIEGIEGSAVSLDLTSEKDLEKLKHEPSDSVCLMFKLLDSLESRKRGSAKTLLEHINSKTIIVSFPLKSIGGKESIKSERRWFLKLIQKTSYKTTEQTIGNEKYYIITQTL
jgi:16S rRNA (guanine(1405)-N(7))-methyltransferase